MKNELMYKEFTQFEQQYRNVYMEYFSIRYGNSLKIPKISMNCIVPTLERAYDGILTGMGCKVFTHRFLWNLTYFFLGELYSDLRDKDLAPGDWLVFDRKAFEVRANHEVFFAIMIALKRILVSRVKSLKGTGLPDWFKYENFDQFVYDLKCILGKESTRKGIFKGRPINVLFFKTQKDVVIFLKGRVNDKKILQIIDICKKRSPGWERKKGFRDLKEFDLSFKALKAVLLENHGEEWLKKKKITDGVMMKYLLYLGLIATIQSRVEEPVEMKASVEQEIFNFYKCIRNAASSLGHLTCFDPTFCPGVRSKSFVVKIMCKPLKLQDDLIFLNKIENDYMNTMDEEKVIFAMNRSYQAPEFLRDRIALFRKQEMLPLFVERNRKLRFAAYKFGKTNGSKWVNEKYKEICVNMSRKSIFKSELVDFINKYSSVHSYFWLSQAAA